MTPKSFGVAVGVPAFLSFGDDDPEATRRRGERKDTSRSVEAPAEDTDTGIIGRIRRCVLLPAADPLVRFSPTTPG